MRLGTYHAVSPWARKIVVLLALICLALILGFSRSDASVAQRTADGLGDMFEQPWNSMAAPEVTW